MIFYNRPIGYQTWAGDESYYNSSYGVLLIMYSLMKIKLCIAIVDLGLNLLNGGCKTTLLRSYRYISGDVYVFENFMESYRSPVLYVCHHVRPMYEGVSKSSWHHPDVKKPDSLFLYLIHKTSLKSYYAKLHIPPTFYWLSTDQNCYMGAWYWNSHLEVHF